MHRQLPGHLAGRRIRRQAMNGVFDERQTQRARGRTIHRNADSFNLAARHLRRRCDVQERKVPNVPVAHLFKIKLRARPRGRNANRDE